MLVTYRLRLISTSPTSGAITIQPFSCCFVMTALPSPKLLQAFGPRGVKKVRESHANSRNHHRFANQSSVAPTALSRVLLRNSDGIPLWPKWARNRPQKRSGGEEMPKNPRSSDDWMTTEELAELLHTSRSAVHKMVERGQIPRRTYFQRIPRARILFRRSSIDNWLGGGK